MMPPAIRNIGIFAHIDSGKTTLSESILVRTGAVRSGGSVDQGTAHTDSMPVERRRGISVRAASVAFDWKGVRFHLIDTPGHTDFAAEIERSIWPLDGALLLMDAAEGVQPQTEVLFDALRRQHVPMLFFLNKMDREGADAAEALRQIRRMLSPDAVWMADLEEWREFVCASEESLMERYLAGAEIQEAELWPQLAALTAAGQAFPVFAGSALKGQGVAELLDAVVRLLPPPAVSGAELSGVVFSTQSDRTMGRGLLVRLFGGRLENRMALQVETGRDFATGQPRLATRKITQIRGLAGEDLGALEAGMIGVVYGLGDLPVGHVFGAPERLPRQVRPGALQAPLLKVQAIPEKPEELHALRAACLALADEEPLLQVAFLPELNQLQLQVMGTVQLEILEELLRTRFGLAVRFSEPSVIYKETIRSAVRGYIDYTMPKPCWAILEFLLEPGPRGSGVSFASTVPFQQIQERYQHQVEQALPLALKQGRLGWEVTDIKVTLTGGCHHLEHTHPLDFIVATPMGIHNGLAQAENVLLEPILLAKFRLPADCVGHVISDIHTMRGELLGTETDGERVTLEALVPVGSSIHYPTTLARITGGRGAMNIRLHSYRECPLELGATAPRRTIDPVDTAKYILVVRNALEGTLFEG